MLRKSVPGRLNPLTAGQQQIIERFRRLHDVIERHPHLSGLMIDEHHDYLHDIWSEAGFDEELGRYPGGEEPDRALEIGYDLDWSE